VKTTLAIIGAIVGLLAYYVLVGIVVADLWRMSFAAMGLPAMTAYQAVVIVLMFGMFTYRKTERKPTFDMFVDLLARLMLVLTTWGFAYLLGWFL
jgi:hypothetical protein